jgi:acyl transferase domain-containing protein
MSDERDVAVVGMSALFPKAPGLEAFWSNIVEGVDAIGDPDDDWGADLAYDPDSESNDRIYCKRGGFLRDLTDFDPLAHGVMPRAIDGAEPDHFLALRLVEEALEDAGYADRDFPRHRTAVILGRGEYFNRGNVTALQHAAIVDQTMALLARLHPEDSEDWRAEVRAALKASLPPFNAETAPGLVPNVVCGRIANRLDLMGPNYTIDAACASSLLALDAGTRELASGRCDMAIVGGVHACTPPVIFMVFCHLGALSRSGRIRPFDRDADGTLLAEGLGMLVLKRRADAERDGDRVYAVVRGVGVASDGRALGPLAPRLEGEELALRRAYEAAAVDPGSVGLVEAHGTGTPVGDATELEALRRVFGPADGATRRCALGSIKSMIGHTMPAAGIAGTIKAALALHHRVVPPTLNCDEPHPSLGLGNGRFRVPEEASPWIHADRGPRRAGVNAFGFGGINAHVVLEEHAA